MFSSKDHRVFLLGITAVVVGAIFGFGVNRAVVVETQDLASLRDTNTKTSSRQILRRIYTSQIGVREATGKNDGPEVEKYLLYTGLGRGNAWCAAFVSWVYGQAGMDQPKTAWSPALFPDKRVIWAREQRKTVMLSVAEASHKKGETRSIPLRSTQGEVKVGNVFGIYFPELKRIAHCGFVDSWDGIWCTTVEGNTNDVGSVISENDKSNPIRAGPGEGVYRKKRLIKTIYKVADWMDPSDR